MVGNDQELRRIREGEVVGEHLRLDVSVHADQGQILGLSVDLPSKLTVLRGIRERAVGMELEGRHC